jgi:RNA-binding protein
MTKELTSAQRQYLKAMAHPLSPLVTVADAGISKGVVEAIKSALRDHELIKIRMRKPTNKKILAQSLADESQATLCGLVGHTAVLYKKNPEKPKIHVPETS